MSATRFDIGRITVSLTGISGADAEGAARGLEAALADRLGGWRPDVAGMAPMNLGAVDLGSVEIASRLDAAALADLIAGRLIDRVDAAVVRNKRAV